MIVLDSSAAIRGLLGDGACRAYMQTESIAAPHLIDAEVLHALRSLLLRGVLDEAAAVSAVDDWSDFAFVRMEVTGLSRRVWALRHNLSAYDATFVALAEALDVPLVTSDARIARATGPRCVLTVATT